jgi:hydrogenase maturation protein HypF
MIDAIIKDHLAGLPTAQISGRFHRSLAVMIEEVCVQIRQKTGLSLIVLSGGVFQNCLLTEMVLDSLNQSAFKVLTHSLVPPNDGGLALGQAVVASSLNP